MRTVVLELPDEVARKVEADAERAVALLIEEYADHFLAPLYAPPPKLRPELPPPGFAKAERLAREAAGDTRTLSQILADAWDGK